MTGEGFEGVGSWSSNVTIPQRREGSHTERQVRQQALHLRPRVRQTSEEPYSYTLCGANEAETFPKWQNLYPVA